MSESDLEAVLSEVRRMVARVEARLRPAPTAVSLTEAARLLAVSSRHLSRLVRRGELRLSDIGGARRVSMAEVERLAREGTAPRVPARLAKAGLVLSGRGLVLTRSGKAAIRG